jgi:hypothetical protein
VVNGAEFGGVQLIEQSSTVQALKAVKAVLLRVAWIGPPGSGRLDRVAWIGSLGSGRLK